MRKEGKYKDAHKHDCKKKTCSTAGMKGTILSGIFYSKFLSGLKCIYRFVFRAVILKHPLYILHHGNAHNIHNKDSHPYGAVYQIKTKLTASYWRYYRFEEFC